MATACEALKFPVVSGNVSLYNETDGRAILPTPAIGGLGVIDDAAMAVGIALPPWLDLVLIGASRGWPRPVAVAARDRRETRGGEAPPPVDLAAEKVAGDFVRMHRSPREVAARGHDVSDGGLLVAVAEMCMAQRRWGAAVVTGLNAIFLATPSGSARTRDRYQLAVADSFTDHSGRGGCRACRWRGLDTRVGGI